VFEVGRISLEFLKLLMYVNLLMPDVIPSSIKQAAFTLPSYNSNQVICLVCVWYYCEWLTFDNMLQALFPWSELDLSSFEQIFDGATFTSLLTGT
jgi:hypothetical protein